MQMIKINYYNKTGILTTGWHHDRLLARLLSFKRSATLIISRCVCVCLSVYVCRQLRC